MISIEQYIQEKYLIDNDYNNEPAPNKAKLNKFIDWLEKEFKVNKAFKMGFKDDLLEKLNLHDNSFELEKYDENEGKIADINITRDNFKKIEGIDSNWFISSKNIRFYYFKFRCNGVLIPTLYITDDSKNIMYIYTINILL